MCEEDLDMPRDVAILPRCLVVKTSKDVNMSIDITITWLRMSFDGK